MSKDSEWSTQVKFSLHLKKGWDIHNYVPKIKEKFLSSYIKVPKCYLLTKMLKKHFNTQIFSKADTKLFFN